MGQNVTTKYDFGEQFQQSILSLVLRDPSFGIDYRDSLDPIFFEDPHLSTISQIALQYLDRKGRPPELPVLQLELERWARQYGVDQQDSRLLLKKATAAYTRPPADEEYVRNRALEFAQMQALKSGVRKAADMLYAIEKGKANASGFAEIRTTLERSLRIGLNGVHDLGTSMGDNPGTLPKYIKKAYAKGEVIPTGFPSLDRMMRGGIGRGEVGIVFGIPKRGKSTVLVNIGAWASRMGFKVIHYSFELRKADVIMKYSSRATGMSDEQILDLRTPQAIRKFEKRCNQWYGHGSPWIVYERPGQVGVEWIRSHLSRLQSVHEVKPDLIIIDFMDRMAKRDPSNLYVEGGTAMEKLTALGADFNAGVWTASQAGRQAEDKDTTRQSDASESWRKMADCDISVSLNQTIQEKIDGLLTLFVTGQRRGMDTRYIHCEIDYKRSFIREKEMSEKRKAKRSEEEKVSDDDSMGSYFDAKKAKQRRKNKKQA